MSMKKFLSVLLALTMLLSAVAVFAAAAGAQTVQSDIAPVGDNNGEAGTKTITVGLDNAFMNKIFYGSSATSAPFQVHYWGGADGEGDTELLSINEKESMLIAEYDIEVEFYLYSAKIPADAKGFKVRKGNNWFGDDADMSVDHVYMYMYLGEDKFIYDTWGEEPADRDGYYIVGSFTDWKVTDGYKMTPAPDTVWLEEPADGNDYTVEAADYVYEGLALTTTSQFKVVKVEGDKLTWNPEGTGNNYGENGEITADGEYDVYFYNNYSENYGRPGSFHGCIYVESSTEGTAPETQVSTEPVDDRRPVEKMPYADDLTAGMDTVTVYFQMPDGTNCFTDEEGNHVPSWENENNPVGSTHYAGIYWWEGSMTTGAWPGAKMTVVDGEQNIFSANIPAEEDLTNVIFNNAVDGGTDTTAEIYDMAFQTVDLNVQGAEPGDYDTLPEGSPDPDSFDGCIFVPDNGAVFPTSTLSKTLYPGRWYIYYGGGCYGMYAMDSENFTTVEDMCCNPSHDHVKPTEPAIEDGCYVVGNFTDWAVDEAYKMTINEFADTEEYMLTLDLKKDSYCKVVCVRNGENCWYPDGMGDPGLKIDEDGSYTVYFRPNMDGGDDWHYKCIYAARSGDITGYKLGDVNGDDEVDTVDATFIQRYATKIAVPFSEAELMRGDVDGDGDATIVDATYIQRYATKVAVPYPIGEKTEV